MKLLNPSDAELNAAFAIRVAEWTAPCHGFTWKNEHGRFQPDGPPFTTSADAVLPWLEKREDVEIHRVQSDGWQVSIMEVKRTPESEETGVIAEAWEDTLPKAATIALLRAHGVEVEFTNAPKTP